MTDHEHHPAHDHGHGHGAHQHHHGEMDEAAAVRWAADIEVEGEMMLGFVTATVEQLQSRPEWTAPQRVADLGSGPGVAACELARLFPASEVIAFDPSEPMLQRARARIDRLGLADRVSTVAGEMPHDLDRVGEVDLVWASMSLHHVGDEVTALRALRGILAPGGVIAIAEMADPMRTLPSDLGTGRPGLADRLEQCWTAWFRDMRHGLDSSVESQDLATMVAAAGLTILDDRVERIRLAPPLDDPTKAFVAQVLTRARAQLASMLDADDLATIDVLLDEDDRSSIARRDDVFVEASRRIVIARVS